MGATRQERTYEVKEEEVVWEDRQRDLDVRQQTYSENTLATDLVL